MPAQSTQSKGQLFDIYEKNLSILSSIAHLTFEVAEGSYLCPICLRAFDKTSAFLNEALTLEHIVPRSLGGARSDCVLTCKKCNNSSGIVEGKFKASQKVRNALKGKSSDYVAVQYSVSSGGETVRLPAKFRRQDDQYELIGIPEQSNPKSIQKVVEKGFEIDDEITIHFTISDNRRGNVNIALLKIAYLRLFSILGYSAILAESMDKVRRQILKPQDEKIHSFALLGNDLPYEGTGVFLCDEPADLSAYHIVFDIVVESVTNRMLVVLPSPVDSELNIYNRIRNINGKAFSIRYLPLPPDNAWLHNKDAIRAISRFWYG